MDNYNVPKKVNRHVLKAINILSGGNRNKGITVANIRTQVKYQMRNLVPVAHVDRVIEKSLKNMSEIGLIESQGRDSFCMGKNYHPQPYTLDDGPPSRTLFKVQKKPRAGSTLNPNLKRNLVSEDSLSGDEILKSRKRLRTNNKKIKRDGKAVALPGAFQRKCNFNQFRCQPIFGGRAFGNEERMLLDLCLESDSELSILMSPMASSEITPIPSLEIIPIPSLEITPMPSLEYGAGSITEKDSTEDNVNDVVKISEVGSNAQSKDSKLSVQNGSEGEQPTQTSATGQTDIMPMSQNIQEDVPPDSNENATQETENSGWQPILFLKKPSRFYPNFE